MNCTERNKEVKLLSLLAGKTNLFFQRQHFKENVFHLKENKKINNATVKQLAQYSKG